MEKEKFGIKYRRIKIQRQFSVKLDKIEKNRKRALKYIQWSQSHKFCQSYSKFNFFRNNEAYWPKLLFI